MNYSVLDYDYEGQIWEQEEIANVIMESTYDRFLDVEPKAQDE